MGMRGVLATLSMAVLVSTASAAPAIIDFSTGSATSTGTLSYAGGAAPLVGTAIGIGLVRGDNTPSNAGVTDTVSAFLNFNSGNFISYDAGSDTYKFAGGGSITITGTAPGCTTVGGCGGNTPDAVAGPTLLTGTVVSATYQDSGVDLNIDLGSDTKDLLLTNFFGFKPDVSFKFSGTVHASLVSGGGGGAFLAGTTNSTDIRNTAVPEPISILLLGTVMFVVTRSLRNRLAAV